MAEPKTNNNTVLREARAESEAVVWGMTFHRQNYDDDDLTLLTQWPDLKYCIFTCGTNKYGRSQVIGFVQFETPMLPTDVRQTFPQFQWKLCKYGSRASVNYVTKCSNNIRCVITEVGDLWGKKDKTVTR